MSVSRPFPTLDRSDSNLAGATLYHRRTEECRCNALYLAILVAQLLENIMPWFLSVVGMKSARELAGWSKYWIYRVHFLSM
jgi:hypothetical protein